MEFATRQIDALNITEYFTVDLLRYVFDDSWIGIVLIPVALAIIMMKKLQWMIDRHNTDFFFKSRNRFDFSAKWFNR